MARLAALPAQEVVDRMKGTIDYYYYKGIPCARMWPHWRKRQPTPEEKANQDTFAYAARSWKALPEFIKKQYNRMATSVSVTGRDIFMRAYINGQRPQILP